MVNITQIFKDNNEDYLQISVNDTGCGIKKKDRKRLFKLYGSIKSSSFN